MNNKGFAVTGIFYSILVIFLVFIVLMLFNLQNRKTILDELKLDSVEAVEEDNNYEYLLSEINSLKNSQVDVDEIYPVGSIYISVNSTNPGSIIGGTWVEFGNGKTIVGVNASSTSFNTAEKTGGSSTVTLTANNLPSHTHSIPALTGTAASAGAHGYHLNPTGGNYYLPISALSAYNSRPYTLYSSNEAALATQTLGAHTHSVTTTASTTGATGSASAVSIQNPYITVYMWKRTA